MKKTIKTIALTIATMGVLYHGAVMGLDKQDACIETYGTYAPECNTLTNR